MIFTPGCTGALKLVAETFDYHGNCCDESTGCKRGSFSYLHDNHTSVHGMREIAFDKARKVQCLDCDDEDTLTVEHVLHEEKTTTSNPNIHCGNHLVAYPAQSNFSGRKYPLQWVAMVTECQFPWQQLCQQDLAKQLHMSNVTEADATFDQSNTHSYGCQANGCYGDRCHGNWYTVLDAASFVSTSPLNLSAVKPDFVTISFYKIFGIPTGLGKCWSKHKFIVPKKTSIF